MVSMDTLEQSLQELAATATAHTKRCSLSHVQSVPRLKLPTIQLSMAMNKKQFMKTAIIWDRKTARGGSFA